VLANDLRFAVRLWKKTPGAATVALLSLTLGLGANAVIFTFVKELFIPRMPVRNVSEVVMVYSTTTNRSGELSQYQSTSYPNAQDYRDLNDVFSGLSIIIDTSAQLDTGGIRTAAAAHLVSGNYFSLLGLVPTIGRTLAADDDSHTAATPPTVLSHALWTGKFGSNTSVLGTPIRLNNRTFVIVGVAPADFHDVGALGTADVWVPITAHEQLLTGNLQQWLNLRAARVCMMVARLKPGISLTAAQASLSLVGSALAQQFPSDNAGRNVMVVPLTHTAIAPSQRSTYVLASELVSGIAGLVLLIACANVASLLLARALQRRREFSVRLALGASRARLVVQLLTEGVLFAAVAAVLAIGFAYSARVALLQFVPLSLRPNLTFSVDYRVALFTAAAALVSTIMFGLAPAWQASQCDGSATLDHVAPPRQNSRILGIRGSIVVLQIALSYVALAVAALFVRSLLKAQVADPGFEVSREVVVNLDLAEPGYDGRRSQQFLAVLLDRVRALPSVEHASLADSAPLAGGFRRTTFPAGANMSDPATGRLNTTINVAPGFFAAAGLRLLRGRDFTEHDDARSAMVAIVNEAAANAMWPSADPLGQRLRFLLQTWDVMVVGVVNTVTLRTIGETPQPIVYFPLRQHDTRQVVVYAKARSDAAVTAADLSAAVKSLDPMLQPQRVRVGEQIVGDLFVARRIGAGLLVVFGALALVLATIGAYGVASYSVTERTREMAIRRALGASRFSVMGLIVAQGAAIGIIGVVIGMLTAAAATNVLVGLTFGVGRLDVASLVGAATLMFGGVLVASLVAARRATQLAPMEALRAP
jgi:predicted permease